MRWYEVALWRWWPSLMPEYVEMVRHSFPRLAVCEVMQRHGRRYVERAAVVEVVAVERPGWDGEPRQCWRRVAPIQRWPSVLCPKQLQEVSVDD
jgi:hypothetical protein